jgi:tetratricopeptide (TPR) repeat protein
VEVTDVPSNAAFISYRRDVAGILAMALYQHLTDREVDAFYDIESIRAGRFDTIILNQIAARPYFLLVLTPGTLERCHDPGDWLLREIEQAIATRRLIVPVHTPSFDFDDITRFLPPELAGAVRRFNGQELPQRWFKFAVQQLIDEFLVPIQTADAVVPVSDRAVVDELIRRAQAAPTVTPLQLSAEEYFERALARPPNDADGKIADYSEAIRLNPVYAAAFNNRGNALRTKGDENGAIADYNEVIRLDSQDAAAYNNRGNARWAKDDLNGAIADYSEAIRLVPEYGVAYINRGNARWANDDVDGAIADFDEVIRLDPYDAEALKNRGIARSSRGDLEGAIADHSAVLRLDPRDTDALNNRGVARWTNGDLQGAITDFDESIRLNPRDPDVFNIRGVVHAERGDLDRAITDYSETIRLDPRHDTAFNNRGNARRLKGDLDGAIADYEHAIQLAPGENAYHDRLNELRTQGGRGR